MSFSPFVRAVALSLVVIQFCNVASVLADDVANVSLDASTQIFTVTAYYSPLPNQSFYFRGSYEADKILNGNGTNGASGAPVYVGMLAAPKTYAFGTKICLNGVGLGTVDDRGGAIVVAGERNQRHDRIDIWTGYGEEGLRRALAWGRREVTGTVYASGTADISCSPLSLDNVATATREVNALVERLKNPPASDASVSNDTTSSVSSSTSSGNVFSVSLGTGDKGTSVRALQEILSALGYYTGDLDSVYSDTLADSVYRFQKDRGLVDSRDDLGAGYFGPKTRRALATVYGNNTATIETARADSIAADEQRKTSERIDEYVDSIGNPKIGTTGPNIRKLQQTLKLLGYFSKKNSGTFDITTRNALIAYQIDKGIIESKRTKGAGTITKATKEAFTADLAILSEVLLSYSGEQP